MIHFESAEIVLYLLIWVSAVFYSILSFFFESSNYFSIYTDDYNDFEPGYFIQKQRDVADLEWQTMIYLLKKIWLWILIILFVSEIMRKKRQVEVLKLFQIVISVIFILINLGPIALFGIIVQPIIFNILHSFTQKQSVLWASNVILIFIISFYKYQVSNETFMKLLKCNEKENYLHILAIYWTNLRSFSYFMDQNVRNKSILDLFSYCLYLPMLFNGPFIFYADFKNSQMEFSCLKDRITQLVKNVSRFLFWLLFIEIALHFIYVNATSFQVQLVESLNGWALYGYGYLMGQYFHMKYVVVYGLSTSIAKFENIPVPSLPKCIGRIHLYSDMWKYFDNGLYKFLLRYIYVPVMQLSYVNNKFIASLLCFTFVYIWHGLDGYIFIWVILNFIGIALENISASFYNTYLKGSEIMNNFGANMLRRITCFFATFLLAMSAISNFYFFAGVDIGTIFVTRVFGDGFTNSAVLILCLYCCCQISTELRIKSNKRGNKD